MKRTVDTPQLGKQAEIDKIVDGRNDDGRKRRIRDVVEQRRQKQQRQYHQHAYTAQCNHTAQLLPLDAMHSAEEHH